MVKKKRKKNSVEKLNRNFMEEVWISSGPMFLEKLKEARKAIDVMTPLIHPGEWTDICHELYELRKYKEGTKRAMGCPSCKMKLVLKDDEVFYKLEKSDEK